MELRPVRVALLAEKLGSHMRKQYHVRPSEHGRLIWDVDRLVALTANFPRRQVPMHAIRELDEAYWFGNGTCPTCRAVADHAWLIQETDLCHPIILSADGRVMDGMHRVARAYLEGHTTIEAVQFEVDPEPDYIDVDLDDLPYDDPDTG
ncbi:MAG TPA: hypothetical protein VKP65_09535 [Rhodothermales bacterium]|nr:hypothetical protein [Rhodothermales bacterium]